ncbi:hypothetical protein FHU37_002256 [Allostreptomyces psammosilenae]|uniref:Uncharacterized protein n=1 Tax=Allostreptomyces psammosilenae TaxID=1892865 RepID=A0A852ZSE4_9ACTN|nr:hypothetical protein [Allostreptomyces psammosilenae]
MAPARPTRRRVGQEDEDSVYQPTGNDGEE